MAEKAPRIVQGKRVYVFTSTEEKVIGDTVWTRDRYDNENGDPQSYLLVNFQDTGRPANIKSERKIRIGRPTEETGKSIRDFIRAMDYKERLGKS